MIYNRQQFKIKHFGYQLHRTLFFAFHLFLTPRLPVPQSTPSLPQILSLPPMAPPSPSLLSANTCLLFNVTKTILICSFIITTSWFKSARVCENVDKNHANYFSIVWRSQNVDKNHICFLVCSKGIPATSPFHHAQVLLLVSNWLLSSTPLLLSFQAGLEEMIELKAYILQ